MKTITSIRPSMILKVRNQCLLFGTDPAAYVVGVAHVVAITWGEPVRVRSPYNPETLVSVIGRLVPVWIDSEGETVIGGAATLTKPQI